MKKGFTFLEIIIAVALMAILTTVVIILVRPGEQLERMGEAKRRADITLLNTTMQRYIINRQGEVPSGVDGRLRMLGTASNGCSFPCARDTAVSFTEGEFGDYISNDFNQGSYDNTFYSAENGALAIATGTEGSFTSRIFDAEEVVSWSSLAWQPVAPYGKNLPAGNVRETVYESGNINMEGNVLLLHLDEQEGAESFLNKSSAGGSGSCGTSCPTTGVSGVLGKATSFNGATDAIVVPNREDLNPTSQITLMSWVKWSIDPTTSGQWTSIINKGVDSQYRLQHNSSNTAFEMAVRTSDGARWAHSTTTPQAGVWYHVAGTYDGSDIRIYVNGELEETTSHSGDINTTTSSLFVGARSSNDRHFAGDLDEVVMWNRALSSQEINNIYKRGAMKVDFQVRSCSSSNCAGVSFSGPSGTESYYNEGGESSNQLPKKQLVGVDDNRYFQYKVLLRSKEEQYTPFVKAVSLEEEFFGEVGETVDECLDLTSTLVPDYINEIPYDPEIGNSKRTHYAVYQTGGGRVIVVPCFNNN